MPRQIKSAESTLQRVNTPLPLADGIYGGVASSMAARDAGSHGLRGLLASIDLYLQSHGLTLSFVDFDALAEINEANRDSWRPLLPTFHPASGLVGGRDSFCLVGRDADGLPVTTQAMRLFDWSESDLAVEAESLRMFYRNPKRSAPAGARCVVAAAMAKRITGRVAFGGAVWYHPNFRRRALVPILARVSRIVAYARWKPDLVFAIFARILFDKGFSKKTGFAEFDESIVLDNFPVSPYTGVVGMISQNEMLTDFKEFFSSGISEIGLIDRRAPQ